MTTRNLQRLLLIPIAFLSGLVATLLIQQVVAGGVTNPGAAPFTKVGVYQGVISIIPDNASSVMEIGNAGRDIASTGTIYLRPGSVAAAQAISFYKDAATANKTTLDVPGNICLSGVCLNAWPSGAGSSFWTQTGTHVQPVNLGYQVSIARALPLEIYSNHAQEAALFSNALGYSARIESGSFDVTGSLEVTSASPDAITVSDPFANPTECPGNICRVWNPSNDGAASTLDADLLDGRGLSLINNAPGNCSISTFCLCPDFGTCINLTAP